MNVVQSINYGFIAKLDVRMRKKISVSMRFSSGLVYIVRPRAFTFSI